jgi:hypothetical protein
MNKGAFELNSSRSDPDGLTIRYFDLLGTDRDRYVDENNRIRFRVRVVRKKVYPVAYDNEDASHCQVVTDVNPDTNKITPDMITPWVASNGTTYDFKFDYAKVGLLEYVKKLGLDYFAAMSI